MNGLKVCSEKCERCLFSANPLVNASRRKKIIEQCLRDGAYFACHEGTARNEDVCCRGWYDTYGDATNLIRIAQRMRAVEMVDPKGEQQG